jgi:hypothetical protein
VVYVSLPAYLNRVQAAHRVPRIVQLADRRFRINQSPDDRPPGPVISVIRETFFRGEFVPLGY